MTPMAEPVRRPYVTAAEYLAFERAAEERHEYIDGEIVAMAGGTSEHSLIAANLVAELRAALRERPCRAYSSDLRVKIESSQSYTYPDVSVVCGPPRFEDAKRDVLLNPLAIFEVLSDSTEGYDRGEKFAHYRTVPSLADYVLVSQRSALVEHYHRQADGTWLLRALGPGERLVLESLGEVAVDEIYLKVFEKVERDAVS